MPMIKWEQDRKERCHNKTYLLVEMTGTKCKQKGLKIENNEVRAPLAIWMVMKVFFNGVW